MVAGDFCKKMPCTPFVYPYNAAPRTEGEANTSANSFGYLELISAFKKLEKINQKSV